MSDIPKGRVGPGSAPGIATAEGSPLDAELARVLTDIKQTISKAELLARMDWQQFSPEQLQAIQDTILELLAGQLPPETLAQLEAGAIDSETLQKLLEYLVKSGASPLDEATEDLAPTGLAEQEVGMLSVGGRDHPHLLRPGADELQGGPVGEEPRGPVEHKVWYVDAHGA